ncbi:MAG: TIM-barrel domain-containing protein [Candidatus Kryptoniota bacterium]
MTANQIGYMLKGIFILCLVLSPISFAQGENPSANPKAIVISGNARFTVLTPQLIRMEWSEDGKFEDRASLVFINRYLPVPDFKVDAEGNWLIINTGKLLLKYLKNSGKFNENNLSISFDVAGNERVWHPGIINEGNLLGTIRTLDGVKGSTNLDPGLLSRDGWCLIDDSNRPLFDNSSWNWVVPRPEGDRQDWYFFGYGHDYKKELNDYVRVAGRIPMPPRYAFGSWWSRYWAYTDEELKDLVEQFKTYDVPLDVLVVDMDWHQTFDLRWSKRVLDQSGQMKGWTGYTWDKTLFPDPVRFLKWCKERGLRITLNLHPAAGIQPFEENYSKMARAMNVDPSTQKYIPFDITNKKFAENYFKIIIDPLEKEGVDFWWIDWQQWDTTAVRGLNPTWWLNYAFYTHMEKENKERPIILSRWGGLGDHRYQIGFSGDVITDWSSLEFQPYFTATAANVGFGYWSHDIGGHIPGTVSPELYTRWVQWGAFSPILRTHTTRNPEAERRIWAYPYEYFNAMRQAFLMRYSLLPYIYTASREAYDTGVSVVHPLYYEYPDISSAYTFKDQYMFGNDMMIAPVVSPMAPDTMLAIQDVWIPPGTWIEWYSGRKFTGPEVVQRRFALDEIPIYVKSGSIIPMEEKMLNSNEKPLDPLILTIFPEKSGSARIYEDDGNSNGYIHGQYAWTTVSYEVAGDRVLKLKIGPVEGNFPGMLNERSYEIRIMNVLPVESASIVGSKTGWKYDGDRLMAVVYLPRTGVHKEINLTIKFTSPINDPALYGVAGKIKRLKEAMGILNHLWPQDWSPDSLIVAAQTGDRMTLFPENAGQEIRRLNSILPLLKNQIENLNGDKKTIRNALVRLEGVYH